MILAVNNYETRKQQTQPQFKGVLDGALTNTLRTLDTNDMANAVLIDLGAMVLPRTYYDTKERNKYAGAETFFREISGTVINCLSAGILANIIGRIASKRVMPDVKINNNSWFSNDSIKTLKSAWDKGNGTTRSYAENIFNNLEGLDGRKINRFSDINWSKIDWIDEAKWKNIFWYNSDFKGIQNKLTTKEGFIETFTQIIDDKNINKYDKKNVLKIMEARLTNALGAGRDTALKIGDDKLTAKLENILRDAYDMGNDVFTNKNVSVEKVLQKISKINNIKIFGALTTASAIGLTNQYINRKITEKRTGKKGFVGEVDFTSNNKKTAEKDKTLWLKKLVACAGMAAMVLSVMRVKNFKDFVKKLEFTGPVTSGNAIKTVYMSTIIGRFLAADNSTELRESVTRDYFGFLNWLVFGGFAAKGVANMLDKKTENLFNISKEGRGIKHWLNDMSLKTHNEIAARGKEFAKKNLWKLNAAHLGGLAYSFITLGLVLPMINDKMTKYKARKNANAKPETQT